MKKFSDQYLEEFNPEIKEFFKLIEIADYLLEKEHDINNPEVLSKIARRLAGYLPRLVVVKAIWQSRYDIGYAKHYRQGKGNSTDKRMYATSQLEQEIRYSNLFGDLLKYVDKLVDALKKEASIKVEVKKI